MTDFCNTTFVHTPLRALGPSMCAFCLKSLTADDMVDRMPGGYRWADELETENWTNHKDRMVMVVRGGSLADGYWTDMAIGDWN